MSTYAIGDVQGCFDSLKKLLIHINYNPDKDFLWFCGDLINRGPKSLQTLEFIKSLVDSNQALTILGNHDLHFLAVAEGFQPYKMSDTFEDILNSPDRENYVEWLRQQPLCHYDAILNFFMVHAGLIPQWSVEQALIYAKEVELTLKDDNQYPLFLQNMYGDEPALWNKSLQGFERLRFITNVLTRIRFCDRNGRLELKNKGLLGTQTENLEPWFSWRATSSEKTKIIFGHWAALYEDWDKLVIPNIFPIDSGCVWGNELTAFCLESQEYFSVESI